MRCTNCHAELKPGARFCGECGQPAPTLPPGSAAPFVQRGQPATPVCAHCGAPLSAGARFCGECGQAAPASPGTIAPVAQLGSRGPLWPALLVAAVILLLVIGLCAALVSGDRLAGLARRPGSAATSQPAVTVVTPVPPASPVIVVITALPEAQPPEDSVAPTDGSMPTDAPLPTATPATTETPLPTLTPLPTYTPLPTHTPLPTYTPLPTNTPLPPPLPTEAPSLPPPEPIATEAPLAPRASCPDWYAPPQPGKGILVIENHIGEDLQAEYSRGGTGKWVLPAKQGDTPGRLLLQMAPGDHEFMLYVASGGRGHIALRMEEGLQLVSPVWFNDRYDEFVYGLEIPEGCQ